MAYWDEAGGIQQGVLLGRKAEGEPGGGTGFPAACPSEVGAEQEGDGKSGNYLKRSTYPSSVSQEADWRGLILSPKQHSYHLNMSVHFKTQFNNNNKK